MVDVRSRPRPAIDRLRRICKWADLEGFCFLFQMSQDFTSDYTGNEGFNTGSLPQENGEKGKANGGGDSGAAEAPGRDDERYVHLQGWQNVCIDQ